MGEIIWNITPSHLTKIMRCLWFWKYSRPRQLFPVFGFVALLIIFIRSHNLTAFLFWVLHFSSGLEDTQTQWSFLPHSMNVWLQISFAVNADWIKHVILDSVFGGYSSKPIKLVAIRKLFTIQSRTSIRTTTQKTTATNFCINYPNSCLNSHSFYLRYSY